MKKLIATSIVLTSLTVVLTALCLSTLNCHQEPPRSAERPEPASVPSPSDTEQKVTEQKPEKPPETQTLPQKQTAAATAQSQRRDQSEADRQQLPLDQPVSAKQRTDMLHNADEAGVPYADPITYPKDWREVIQRPSRKPDAPVPPLTTQPAPAPGEPSARKSERWEWPSTYDHDARANIATTVEPLRKEVDLGPVGEDEIWVVVREKPQGPQAPGPQYETPGSGAMLAQIQEKKVPLPLKHTDVKGKVSGYIATVEVVQQFQNPFSEKIEAVYVFPLPENAAVNEFIMVIGDRRIRGIIRERQEAERIYVEARRQGYVASLLTQERPNIFTQKVANIEPGKAIDVHIKYFNTLAYADGWYEFTFPMVVGPRFNPPCRTDGVGAVGRGHAGLSGQATEVQYLKPHERSGHDISLAVDLDAGVKIEEVACSSHAIKKNRTGSETLHVQLSPLDNIPNKDFVLRFRVAGDTIKSALVTHRDERGGFFTLMLYPPQDLEHVNRAPMEMVFVLDCSGSMSGQPIAKSKEAVKRALRKLGPDDTFQVVRFSVGASQLGPNPIPATPENVRKALAYVDALEGEGGTIMVEGIKAALGFPHDPRRFRLVSFMTDGYIGNEAQILGEICQRLGDTRIFSFGIGSSVNRYLLDRMAKLGKGAVAYIGLNDNSTEAVDSFYDCISHPALTDVQIDWGQMEVSEVYPKRVPDLFVGRPIILTGRFQGATHTTIRVSGCVGGFEKEIRIPVEFGRSAPTHPGLVCVWARKRIEDLSTRTTYDTNPDLPGEIKQVALQYGLMSAYTAFLAVDSTRTTQGDHGVTVRVPVPVPDGVRYDTTVQD